MNFYTFKVEIATDAELSEHRLYKLRDALFAISVEGSAPGEKVFANVDEQEKKVLTPEEFEAWFSGAGY